MRNWHADDLASQDVRGSILMAFRSESTEAHVRRYVGLEVGRDDPVTFVQQVGERRVAGQHHEIFDVRCTKTRWWVITNATCLYSQDDFKTYEAALTYHVGLSVMMAERSRMDMPQDKRQVIAGAWRRLQQAAEDMHASSESADFQAIGLKCRDALLAVAAQISEPWLKQSTELPKAGDVKSWAGLVVAAFSHGPIRAYATASLYRTWDLTVWLQHHSRATEREADIVLSATRWALELLALLTDAERVGTPERCPSCSSYRLQESGEPEHFEDGSFVWWTWRVCDGCGWQSERVVMKVEDDEDEDSGPRSLPETRP
jgi:hypothetical protein